MSWPTYCGYVNEPPPPHDGLPEFPAPGSPSVDQLVLAGVQVALNEPIDRSATKYLVPSLVSR